MASQAERTRAVRMDVFDCYAKWNGDGRYDDDPDGLWLNGFLDLMMTRVGLLFDSNTHMASLRLWLANPAKFSPFIDPVAIERAMNFDWPVVQALSMDERSEFYRRLAAMHDPFSLGYDPELLKLSGMTWAQPAMSKRRTAWLAGTKSEHDSVTRGMSRVA
jgi:hypothetical protein